MALALEPPAPARVVGSAWLLRELLSNLIDNALCYTPADGCVTVRCGRVGRGVKPVRGQGGLGIILLYYLFT